MRASSRRGRRSAAPFSAIVPSGVCAKRFVGSSFSPLLVAISFSSPAPLRAAYLLPSWSVAWLRLVGKSLRQSRPRPHEPAVPFCFDRACRPACPRHSAFARLRVARAAVALPSVTLAGSACPLWTGRWLSVSPDVFVLRGRGRARTWRTGRRVARGATFGALPSAQHGRGGSGAAESGPNYDRRNALIPREGIAGRESLTNSFHGSSPGLSPGSLILPAPHFHG